MGLQQAWLRGLEWDEEFPSDLKVTTQQWAEQLAEASKVKVRCCHRLDEKVEQVSSGKDFLLSPPFWIS